MTPAFRQRVASKDVLHGTMVTLPLAATAEVLADAGFDWLFLDAEHGALTLHDIEGILQAVGRRLPCVVRVISADEVPIKQVLDLGAAGIIAPQVNSAAAAADVVRFSRYPPAGSRGVGLARAHDYGFAFDSYLERANDSIAVIVQAEHVDAVDSIESIVAVDGIDAVFLGPYDLSASLGRMGELDHPDVQQAIDHVIAACKAADKPLGFFGVSAEAIRSYVARGCTLVVAGVDTLMLGTAARELRHALTNQFS